MKKSLMTWALVRLNCRVSKIISELMDITSKVTPHLEASIFYINFTTGTKNLFLMMPKRVS